MGRIADIIDKWMAESINWYLPLLLGAISVLGFVFLFLFTWKVIIPLF